MSRHGSIRAFVLLCSILLLFLAPSASGATKKIILDPAAEPSWQVAVNGIASRSSDAATDVIMTSGGVAWVAGAVEDQSGNHDLSLTKIVNGVRKWTKTYDAYGGPDAARQLAVGPGGVVYTVGLSYKSGAVGLLLVKWSPGGAILWKRRYDIAAALITGTGVVVDKAGNVTVCGYESWLMSSTGKWVMRSYTPGGALRWKWLYAPGSGGTAVPEDICVAGDGSVYATGYLDNSGVQTAMTVRVSAAGKKLWMKTYRGPDGLGATTSAIVRCPSGGVYVCGQVQTSAHNQDGLVMRYAPNGARRVFALDTAGGGTHNERFNDLTVTSTKKIIAVGSSSVSGTYDCRSVTYRSDGTLAVALTFPGTNGGGFTCVAADSMGGFVAGGYWWTSATNCELCAVRGSTLTGGGWWATLFPNPVASTAGRATAIAARGNVVVVVGEYESTVTSDSDQIVLGFVY
ncbi:MAG TPA: hypothetical protein PLZ92_14725 [Phycicoccus sp.]|nr:hypothetical protein [Phycicoccus sp.]